MTGIATTPSGADVGTSVGARRRNSIAPTAISATAAIGPYVRALHPRRGGSVAANLESFATGTTFAGTLSSAESMRVDAAIRPRASAAAALHCAQLATCNSTDPASSADSAPSSHACIVPSSTCCGVVSSSSAIFLPLCVCALHLFVTFYKSPPSARQRSSYRPDRQIERRGYFAIIQTFLTQQ